MTVQTFERPWSEATQRDLRDQYGQRDEKHGQQVYKHEGPAAALPGDVGKFPDVAEADGSADRGQQESDPG